MPRGKRKKCEQHQQEQRLRKFAFGVERQLRIALLSEPIVPSDERSIDLAEAVAYLRAVARGASVSEAIDEALARRDPLQAPAGAADQVNPDLTG